MRDDYDFTEFEDLDAYDEGLSFEDEFEGEDAFGADAYGGYDDPYGDDYADEMNFEQIELIDGIDEWRFLKKAWNGIRKVAKTVAPIAKKLAPWAGRAIGMALGGPAGAAIGGKLGGFVGSLEDEEDYWSEGGDGEDSEDEMNAEDFFQPGVDEEEAAEMMAHAAAKSRKPSEAGALAAASAATLAAKAPAKVKAVIPVISAASSNVAQVMTKSPKAAVLKKTLPTIQKKTIATLVKKAAKGKPVTPNVAKRVMTKHATRVLNSQGQIAKAIAKNETKRRSLDKKAVMRAERFD